VSQGGNTGVCPPAWGPDSCEDPQKPTDRWLFFGREERPSALMERAKPFGSSPNLGEE